MAHFHSGDITPGGRCAGAAAFLTAADAHEADFRAFWPELRAAVQQAPEA